MSKYDLPADSTVSLSQESTDILVSGANWSLAGIAANSTLRVNGRSVTIASVPTTGLPQLALPWSDDDVVDALYEVYPDLDAVTFTATAAQFMAFAQQMMVSGRLVDQNDQPLPADCYIGINIKAFGIVAPPANPFLYDMYVLGTSPTGTWNGQGGKIAVYTPTGWRLFAPFNGLSVALDGSDVLYRYSSGNWTPFGPSVGDLSAVNAAGGDVSLATPGAVVGGVTMSAGMTFLNFSASSPPGSNAAYGKYVWNGASVAATRSSDANTEAKVGGARVFVQGGTYAGKSYRCQQAASSITLGTTALTYVLTADESSETVRAQAVEAAILQLLRTVSDLDALCGSDGIYKVWSVDPSGVFRAFKVALGRVDIEKLTCGSIALETIFGIIGATLSCPSSGSSSGRQMTLADGAGQIAFELLDDGSVSIRKFLAGIAKIEKLYAQLLAVTDSLGAVKGVLGALSATNVAVAFTDAAGAVAPLAVAPDGEVLTKYDGALPVVGSKQACDGSYLVVARTRPGSASRKHDLWSINLTTGTEVQITTDATDTFDFLNPVICGANCIYTKRRGEQVRRKAVALSGGAEADVFPSTELHMIGDSFATTDLMTQIVANLTNPNRFRSVDGLGGASLNSHYCRFHGGTVASDASTPDLGTIYPGTPIYWGDTLIIMDGGLTDLDPVVQVGNIIATATPAIKRVAYVEPGYNVGDGAIGSPGYTAWAAEKAAVQTAYPNIYCPTLAFMQSHGDGSANDNSDIANGWWPRSLRDGVIHPNTSGKAWLGLCIATFINSKGW